MSAGRDLVHHVGGRVAQHALGADVEDLDDALRVGGDAREVGAVEDRALQGVTLGQRLFGGLQRADVAHRGLQPDLSLRLHAGQQHFGGKGFAVQAPVAPFEEVGAVAQGGIDHLLCPVGRKASVRLAFGRDVAGPKRDEVRLAGGTEHPHRLAIGIGEGPGGRLQYHQGIARAFEQLPILLFAVAQDLLRRRFIRDIAEDQTAPTTLSSSSRIGAQLSAMARSPPSRAISIVWLVRPRMAPLARVSLTGLDGGWRVSWLTMRKTSSTE